MNTIKEHLVWPFHQAVIAFASLKTKAKKFRDALTRENIKEMIRDLFIHIGNVFCLVGIACSLPAFAIEALITRCTRRPTSYTVGSPTKPLAEEELAQGLSKHLNRKVKNLTIHHSPDSALIFNDRAAGALKEILPKKIFLEHVVLPDDLLNELETQTHHYTYDESGRCYRLTKKITHLVLPSNTEEALRHLDSLADQDRRAVNIYLQQMTITRELKDAINALQPSAIFQVLDPANMTPDEIHTLVTLR